jgi:hypothetical protein
VIWVVVLACAGLPIVWVVGPLVVGTVTADHGEGSPGAALLAFVYTLENGPDATGVERLIDPRQRTTIVKQRRTYLAEMAADTKATRWSGTFETGSPLPGDHIEIHGDRATVVDSFRVRWTPPADTQRRIASSGSVLWFDGDEPAMAGPGTQGPNRVATVVGHHAAVVRARRLLPMQHGYGAEPVTQRVAVSGRPARWGAVDAAMWAERSVAAVPRLPVAVTVLTHGPPS